MKKLLVILLLISAQIAFGQTSGWEEKGIYNEQKLKVNNLNLVHFNEDGTKFYTLHSNKMIYYWETESGSLLDSMVIIEDNAIGVFSKDGKSLCIYLPIISQLGLSFDVNVAIYDLSAKKRIAKSRINIPKDIYYSPPSSTLGWIDFGRYVTVIDYDYKFNRFICGVRFVYYYAEGDGPFLWKHYSACGGTCVYETSGDSLVNKVQLSTGPILDIIFTNNIDYKTGFGNNHDSGGSSSLNSDNDVYTFVLNRYNYSTKESKNIIVGGYGTYSYYESGKGRTEYTTGVNKPFTLLFLDDFGKRLFMKSNDIYSIINTETENVVGSIILRTSTGYEKLTYNFYNFVYYFNNEILIQDVISKKILDSLYCPIFINALELIPFGKDIIVTDKSGTILIYKNVINSVNSKENELKSFISPNPATDFIEISVGANGPSPLQSDLRIYNVFGQFQTTPNPTPALTASGEGVRIDVSHFAPGMYFVRIGDRVQKFVKL